MKRSEVLRHLYITMNRYCREYGITFLIVNQITSSFSEIPEVSSIRLGTAALPSLGNTVTQFTHNRYMLCRRGSTYPSLSIFDMQSVNDVCMENNNGVPDQSVRDFYTLFSPRLGNRRTAFTITKNGVVPL